MKGIISKPMPKRWYNENAAANSGDPIDEKICVSKKPYFMIYRYPELHSRHNAFQKTANMRALYECGAPLADILNNPDAFDNGAEFRDWYYKYAPTQVSHGTINRICNMCEDYFAQIKENDECDPFDPSILKTGVDYSRHTKSQIDSLYRGYMARLQDIASCGCDDEEKAQRKIILAEEFRKECALVTPSAVELCDIVVDICYAKEKSKQFAWDMCGDQMIANVIRNSGGKVNWPRATTQGDIVYGGKRFKLETMDMREADDDERYYYERSV